MKKIFSILFVVVVICLFGCESVKPMEDSPTESVADTVLENVESDVQTGSSIEETQTVQFSDNETQPYAPPPCSNQYINELTYDTVSDLIYTLENHLLSENDILDITLGGTCPENLEIDPDKLRVLSGLPENYTELVVEWHGGYNYMIAYGTEEFTPVLSFTPFQSEDALTSRIDATRKTLIVEPVITEYENTENGIRYVLYSIYNKEGVFSQHYLCAFCEAQSFLVVVSEEIISQDVLFSLTSIHFSESSETSSETNDNMAGSEDVQTYTMSIDEGDWMLYEQPHNEYKAGETVVIKVEMAWDVSIVCLVNGADIGTPKEVPNEEDGHIHLEFTFEMPNQDTTIQLNMYDNIGFQ